jgi:hypothetical protein
MFSTIPLTENIQSLAATQEDYEQFWIVLKNNAKSSSKSRIDSKLLMDTNLRKKFEISQYVLKSVYSKESYTNYKSRNILNSEEFDNFDTLHFHDHEGISADIKRLKEGYMYEYFEDAMFNLNFNLRQNIMYLNNLFHHYFKKENLPKTANNGVKAEIKKFNGTLKYLNKINDDTYLHELVDKLYFVRNQYLHIFDSIEKTFAGNEEYKLALYNSKDEQLVIDVLVRGEFFSEGQPLTYLLDFDKKNNVKYAFLRKD